MKLKLHHIEMCVEDLSETVKLLRDKFGFKVVGSRVTPKCEQIIVQTSRTVFVVTCRAEFRRNNASDVANNNYDEKCHQGHVVSPSSVSDTQEATEPWTTFCCQSKPMKNNSANRRRHIDSVFNIAIQVDDLGQCLTRLIEMNCKLVHDATTVSNEFGAVTYAIVKSCCGNVLHTLIEKTNYNGWFLPGFSSIETVNSKYSNHVPEETSSFLPTHFDHVALACHVGQTNQIIQWYQDAFGMRRFITNRQDTDEEGLVIAGEVGMRLKVMEFWKCSETGIEPDTEPEPDDATTTSEPLKIVVVESLANIRNTQVDNFLEGHTSPGIQHIGLYTESITDTVALMIQQGVRFRHPPANYYTEIGQLGAITSVGEDVELLKKYGILLDSEADAIESYSLDNLNPSSSHSRYLMQIFTYAIFNDDTFFLEIIQRKGARGFGVGNVTALARSINASSSSSSSCSSSAFNTC